MYYRWLLALIAAASLAACSDPYEGTPDGGRSDAKFTEAGGKLECDDPTGDWDDDGILNGEELCDRDVDSDNDGTPDWQDFDSDNDGIPDAIEKGEKSAEGTCATAKGDKNAWPCDTDGDGYADYLDVDSDGDGVDDKDEDANGDGLLGCCLATCGQPAGAQDTCILTHVGQKFPDGTEIQAGQEGCGPGQLCEGGKCTPAIGFACSNGESNPLLQDTFGDGRLDGERGTFICRDATEDSPQGRKPVQTQKSTEGDWHVAIEKSAKYGELKITGAGPMEAAGMIQEEDPQTEVAGFVVSRPTDKEDVQDELADILAAISANVPGGSGTVTPRASGTQGKSHDRFDAVKGTIIDLTLSSSSNVSTVRNELVGTILGKPMAELGNLPSAFGSSHQDFVVRFVTVKRVEFKKDPQTGKLILDENDNPVDSGDKSKWRLVVMGAIASRNNYQDVARPTGFIVDDLSNGTALATNIDTVSDECDVGIIEKLPVADIVWVVDESGSMSDNRDDIVANASNFFSRALASGLDFRMGVTGVNEPTTSNKPYLGKFCSKDTTNQSDDGGEDRFLLSTEQALFSSCVKNPPGYEAASEYGLINAEHAMTRHLPRALNEKGKFRTVASIAFIVATDEIPNSLDAFLDYSHYDMCKLDATTQQKLDQAIKPYIELFSGVTDSEAVATFHVIGGVCSNSCNADVAHGYRELAQTLGGQIGDVCQKDLGNTLQVIIDSIIGAASPVVLEYVPISSSLAVALDGVQLQRSRTNGFDYRDARNSVVLINVEFDKGSELIASYKRWKKQESIEQ